ncbi:hypothetical protein [Thalassospira xiamenensis]|uniref:Uncharacterized protein n=1 Tax=Thalassospira xiamenensis TaxID=220697 RepID=A0A285TIN5_9PROT|nr:hypothetical protein [Thalassospira xiamenensis]SOC21610.1 hypothetical protein SAMN05428964_103452 [Thalassospira xiamenensis]
MYGDKKSSSALADGFTNDERKLLLSAIAGYCSEPRPSWHPIKGFSLHELIRNIVPKMFMGKNPEKPVKKVLPCVVDELIADNVLSVGLGDRHGGPEFVLFYNYSRYDGQTKLEKGVNYRREWVRRVYAEIPPLSQDRMEDVFLAARQASMSFDTASGALTVAGLDCSFAALVPQTITVIGNDVVFEDAILAAILPSQEVRLFLCAPGDISFVSSIDRPLASISFSSPPAVAVSLEKEMAIWPWTTVPLQPASFEFDWPSIEAYIGCPLRKNLRRAFEKVLSKKTATYKHVSGQIRERLSEGIGTTCSRIPMNRVPLKIYNHFASGSDQDISRRRQAIEVYPLFAGLIATNTSIDAAVTEGKPLRELIVAETGLAAPIVKRIGQSHWQMVAQSVASILSGLPVSKFGDAQNVSEDEGLIRETIVRALSICPVENLPRKRAEWRSLEQAVMFLVKAEKTWLRVGQSPWRQKMKDDFIRYLSKDWKRYAAKGIPVSNEYVRDMLKDVTLFVSSAIQSHPLLDDIRPSDLARLVERHLVFGQHQSVAKLMATATDWHVRYENMQATLEDLMEYGYQDSSYKWPPLDSEFACSAGKIEWLTSRTDLVEEHLEQLHCVSSYTGDCFFGQSHIGRVTGVDGSRSTVEFLAKPTELSLNQHFGAKNTPPPEMCVRTVKQFVSKRRKHLKLGTLEDARAQRAKHRPDRRDDSTFDINSPTECSAVLRLYSPFLVKPFRSLDRDELVELFCHRHLRRIEVESL